MRATALSRSLGDDRAQRPAGTSCRTISYRRWRSALELRHSFDCTKRPISVSFLAGIRLMAYGDRKSERVDFESGIKVHIMGIDGTWRRDCTMVDVSQTGARLCIEGSLEGMDLKEFFLLLSSTGSAYRRCKMVRV